MRGFGDGAGGEGFWDYSSREESVLALREYLGAELTVAGGFYRCS